MKDKKIKEIVKKRYSQIARESASGCGCNSSSCCGSSAKDISKEIGYSQEDFNAIPKEANLGLGCGNPTAYANLKKGETVLDLGSGAGIDVFLAAKKVGSKGKVIGVDMTEEMIKRARENAEKTGLKNVEFKLGDIEDLPLEDNSIDVILSNCVINLAPDKSKVFKEAYRVLKRGGRMYLSDIVLLKELSDDQKNDEELIAGCVGNAMLKERYLKIVSGAGFKIRILSEDKGISKKQYKGLPLESLRVEAKKE